MKTLFCLMLCAGILWPGLAPAQEDQISFEDAQLIFGGQKIVKYRKFSLELNDESEDTFNHLMKQIGMFPPLVKENMLIFQVFTCEQELKVKPYIGVVRAQQLIDRLENELGMPRRKCLIQDSGASPFDTECLAGSGINIYLQPEW